MKALRLVTGLAWCLAAAAAGATGPDERWYVLQLGGAPAGYAHEVLTPAADGSAETRTEMRAVLNRLDTLLQFGEDDVTREDADGRLTSLTATIHVSKDDTTLTVVVRPGVLAIGQAAGARQYQHELANTDELLGPRGIRTRTLAWLANPAAPFAYTVFQTDVAAPVHMTRRLSGYDAAGHAILDEHTAGQPGHARVVIDAEGRVLAEDQDSPFGTVSLRLGDATAAHAAALDGTHPELMSKSILRANVRLPDARRLERLQVALELDDPSEGWPDLEGPGQHVVEATPTRRVLELTRVHPARDPPPGAARTDPDLVPNVLLQSDHPDVAALAVALRRDDAGTLEQSLVLRDWVATHLTFDLGLAVAPASEVVRDRRGTCVAYAVLTASLARALGIPARVVLGYVYIDGAFAGHAWTEVRVDDTWVPVDAAVWGRGSADPARIALARHGGEAGSGSGTAELSRLLGHVALRIEGFTLDGRAMVVPPTAAPYRIDGRRYENPWLGVSIEAPRGYRYTDLDQAYPSTTLLTLAGPGHARMTVDTLPVGPVPTPPRAQLEALGFRTRTAGPDGVACGTGRSGRACLRRVGDTVWILRGTADAAAAALSEVARTMTVQTGTPDPTPLP